MKEKIKKIAKKYKSIFTILTLIYFIPKAMYYYIFLLFFSIFKIDNKKIIIVNFYGKGFGDAGKYIYYELLKYDYKIYRATNEKYKNSLPKTINYVKFDSINYLYHMATAKIWINNNRFMYGMRKRNKQFYIQTWHGCIGFKKIGSAAKSKNLCNILINKNDSKLANLFISNSTFCTNNYKNNFYYNGKILECGCPRNDIIINSDKNFIEKIKKNFGFINSEKICLYAPTFRANTSINIYNIEYKTLLNALNNRFGGNWKLLIRLHPDISHLSSQLSGLNKNIFNVTDYPDMQELLVVADFMITDYSSCIFDYAISKKPAIIYASDLEEYKKDTDLLIELEDTPFPIATNNTELTKVISNYDIAEYVNKVNKFYDKMGLKETGKSCKEIVEIINKITKSM